MIRVLLFCVFCIASHACIQTETSTSRAIDPTQAPLDESTYEALSLFGKPLVAEIGTGAVQVRKERDLLEAKQNFQENPDNLENIIWYGRRLAYLSRYKEAIQVYSEGLEKYPESYQLYRHRGHRYITLRKFDAAIADLEKAAFYMRNVPLKLEPDGIPNKINKPLSTIQFNVWYHLGLAFYLKGNYDKAISAYKKCMEVSNNNDMLVATTDWLYMTYLKTGNTTAAMALLKDINADMEIIENDSYLLRLIMYKGEIQPEQLLVVGAGYEDSSLQLATQGYGVGNHFLSKGNVVRAKQVFNQVLETKNWAAFGYIASEAELYNMALASGEIK